MSHSVPAWGVRGGHIILHAAKPSGRETQFGLVAVIHQNPILHALIESAARPVIHKRSFFVSFSGLWSYRVSVEMSFRGAQSFSEELPEPNLGRLSDRPAGRPALCFRSCHLSVRSTPNRGPTIIAHRSKKNSDFGRINYKSAGEMTQLKETSFIWRDQNTAGVTIV